MAVITKARTEHTDVVGVFNVPHHDQDAVPEASTSPTRRLRERRRVGQARQQDDDVGAALWPHDGHFVAAEHAASGDVVLRQLQRTRAASVGEAGINLCCMPLALVVQQSQWNEGRGGHRESQEEGDTEVNRWEVHVCSCVVW